MSEPTNRTTILERCATHNWRRLPSVPSSAGMLPVRLLSASHLSRERRAEERRGDQQWAL